MTITIQQDISGCFGTTSGLSPAELQPYLQRCDIIRARLFDSLNEPKFSALTVAYRADDLSELASLAADWRDRFSRIVLFGTGGSSLGARALSVLAKTGSPEFLIGDNLDPKFLEGALNPDYLTNTGFLVISKSGETVEIIAQTLTAISALQNSVGSDQVAKHILAISEPGNGILRRLCAEFDIKVLDHDPNIGGRFSVLSLVGLFPSLILGLDVEKVRYGARVVLDSVSKKDDCLPAIGAALQVALRDKNFSQSVLFVYGDDLTEFSLWYRQLWAESLGKNGQGTTPINALGPVDQHSQMQLYLDGPRDKQFTFLMLEQVGRGPIMDAELANQIDQPHLAGNTVGNLVRAMQTATVETLVKQERPVRRLTVRKLEEEFLGALFMHFMLETLFAADLMGVDPFGQPAVEDGKVRTKFYLREIK